jgi:hypothetical protein
MSETNANNAGYWQPAFLICAAVLALAGAGMSVAKRQLGLYLKKEPWPLRESLDGLDEAKLSPYRVVAKQKIDNEEIVQSLGTGDYIQWVLEDPREPADSGVQRVLLFVTYYPLPDRVPHVPEECYTGGGYQRLGTDGITFRVGASGPRRSIPGRYLLFGASGGDIWQAVRTFPVLYLFRVNGEYVGSRDDARIALNRNIFGKRSYFCKVELVFNQSYTAPNKEEAVEASERLLTVVLPILEQEHWPDTPSSQAGSDE